MKLEEYKILMTQEMSNEVQRGFIRGFEAAVDLNLPIKFYNWMNGYVTDTGNGYTLDSTGKLIGYNPTEAYQYWLEYIFKIN